jgi:GST-like protein
VQRGVQVLAGLRKPFRTDAEREVLFGAKQYQRR